MSFMLLVGQLCRHRGLRFIQLPLRKGQEEAVGLKVDTLIQAIGPSGGRLAPTSDGTHRCPNAAAAGFEGNFSLCRYLT